MRHPRVPARLPAWARAAAFATALVAAGSGLAPDAAAQAKFDRLFIFGDSYADLTLGNPLATGQPGLSLWNVYPIALADKLKIPTSIDFAVGGATASPLGSPALPPFWNLPQQVDAFESTQTKFGPRDLVTINIGGNDIRALIGNSPALNKAFGYPEEALTPFNAKVFADQTVQYAMGGINGLVQAGAKTFMLGQFSSISKLPELQANLAKLPPDVAAFVAAGADAYAKAYFDGMHAALLPEARSGTRFFVFDLARLGDAVNADPAKYGFTGGFLCPKNGVVDSICGATLANPTNDNPLQSQYYFGPDGLHLTNGGFDLVARYMANILMAPDTIAVQPGLVTTTAGGFTQSLFGRLDGTREAKAGGPVTAYAMGSFLGGDRSGSADLVGYDYESKSGTAGIEYSINRSLILGIAANSTTTSADLTSGANIELEAIQAAAYLAYATKQMFAEIVATYGSHDVGLVRPGVLDSVRSDTEASSFSVAARAGYLFDLGGLRAGPIAGVTYIHSRVDGYTEKGDELLTFNVSAQTLDSLTGNVGLRLLAPFRAGGSLVVPYLNLMLEHQFGDGARVLTVDQVQTNIFLPIMTPFANFESRTYGRIEGGINFELGPEIAASIKAASTFARDDGQDYQVSVGLAYRF